MMLMIFSGFLVSGITCFGLAQDYPAEYYYYYSFKISGYILDSDGQGIAGAMIIFNVPEIVPAVLSDSSGYYEIIAPVGTYHVNVWPPFDSHYISYDEPALAVRSNINKNITLTSGYKVSGYITDSSGAPIVKAVVSMDNYFCGWYSKYSGRYFVTAPAGTYTLRARPANGPQDVSDFYPYCEYNVVVNGDLAKNITVETPSTTEPSSANISGYVLDAEGNGLAGAQVIFGVPDVVPSVFTDDSGYYAVHAPAGTYHVNVWPPFDSNYLFFDQPEFTVETSDISKNITLSSGYKLSGYLTDSSGAPVRGAGVTLSQFRCGWYSDSSGYYFVTAPAGTYNLTIQPQTGPSFSTYTENSFALTGDTAKNISLTQATTIFSDSFDDGAADDWTQHDGSLSANEEESQQNLTMVNAASNETCTHSSHVSFNLPENADAAPLPSKEDWTWIAAAIIVVLIVASPLLYFGKRRH
jgi:protocatechuate 3,4-dioxygenase beta subunit